MRSRSSGQIKPTHILINKTESDGDFLLFNTQDLKTVIVDPNKETATIMTSSARVNLQMMTKHRMERFNTEIKSRYNVLQVPTMRFDGMSKGNTILQVESKSGVKTFIWPKALFSVEKRGKLVTLKGYGGTHVDVIDEEHRIKPSDFTQFAGFVDITQGKNGH